LAGYQPGSATADLDYALGRNLARLVASEGSSAFESGVANRRILAGAQDLLGSETALSSPLRDLLQRPGFRLLFSDERLSQTVGARDALISDLANTYSPSMVQRLASVIQGCLGEPQASPSPAVPVAAASVAPPSASVLPIASSGNATPPASLPMPVVTVQSNNGLVGGLMALISLLAGVLVVGIAWVLMAQRPIQPISAPAPPTAQPKAPESKPEPPPPEPEPIKPEPSPISGISQAEAKSLVDQWLTVKQQIFAPPFDTDIADQLVAAGPLWTDLTKPGGSIEWLRNNNSYYTYSAARVNEVISFSPSETMPSIVVSVTEDSVLHSPRGSEPSSNTRNWVYTFKQEGGSWKLWDYRRQ